MSSVSKVRRFAAASKNVRSAAARKAYRSAATRKNDHASQCLFTFSDGRFDGLRRVRCGLGVGWGRLDTRGGRHGTRLKPGHYLLNEFGARPPSPNPNSHNRLHRRALPCLPRISRFDHQRHPSHFRNPTRFPSPANRST
jgi:hypothetical protein